MVGYQSQKMEKVTFNIPSELKSQLAVLKNEMNVSFSTIYNEAIKLYLKEQEIRKWKKSVEMALKDTQYLELSKELGADSGDIYEY